MSIFNTAVRRILYLSAIGSGLEYFDFTIYALFAHDISLNFFPTEASWAALTHTFIIFAVGYFARPLGGLLLGHIGDTYGRKQAFTYAILVMATATLVMGCLPGYAQIGIWAPVLLVLCRLVQGLSLGGEVAGVVTFSIEHVDNKHAGLMQSLIIISMTGFSALGGLIGFLLNRFISADTMVSWGWRIPFIIGFLLGLLGFVLRRKALETPLFLKMISEKQLSDFPAKRLFKGHLKGIFKGLSLTLFPGCFGSLLLFLPTYLSMHQGFPAQDIYLMSTVGFVSVGVMSVIAGYLSDRFAIRQLMLCGAVLTVIVGYFALSFIMTPRIYTSQALCLLLLNMVLLCMGPSLIQGVYMLGIIKQFPAALRCSGIGLCQNLGLALMAGTAPLVFSLCIQATGKGIAAYYYLIICLCVTILTGRYLNYTAKTAIEHTGSQAS